MNGLTDLDFLSALYAGTQPEASVPPAIMPVSIGGLPYGGGAVGGGGGMGAGMFGLGQFAGAFPWSNLFGGSEATLSPNATTQGLAGATPDSWGMDVFSQGGGAGAAEGLAGPWDPAMFGGF